MPRKKIETTEEQEHAEPTAEERFIDALAEEWQPETTTEEPQAPKVLGTKAPKVLGTKALECIWEGAHVFGRWHGSAAYGWYHVVNGKLVNVPSAWDLPADRRVVQIGSEQQAEFDEMEQG